MILILSRVSSSISIALTELFLFITAVGTIKILIIKITIPFLNNLLIILAFPPPKTSGVIVIYLFNLNVLYEIKRNP